MSTENRQNQNLITKKIQSSLRKVQGLVTSRKKTVSRLMISSMAFSGASTLVAGVTSAAGPVIGSGIEGWRFACIAAAVLGFTSTISTGIIQQMESTDSLSKGRECLTKLKSLDLGITTGRKSWEEIVKEYGELALTYPELIS